MSETRDERDRSGSVFVGMNMAGARFEDVNLGGAAFENVNLGNATIRNANLSGVRIADANLSGMIISGMRIDRLIEAELDRRDPERCRLRMEAPHNPGCVRRVWARLLVVREGFIAMLRGSDDALLTARPWAREWSALECVRHMVFALDYYLRTELLRDAAPWSQVGLVPDFFLNDEGFAMVGSAPDQSLEAVLSEWARLNRQAADFVAELMPRALEASTSEANPDLGDIGGVLRLLAEHELGHIRQAERTIAAARRARSE